MHESRNTYNHVFLMPQLLFHVYGKSKFPLILVKSVFLIKLGAAAVGADSVLAIVYAQDGFAALRQLVVVGCRCEFICGVRRGVH